MKRLLHIAIDGPVGSGKTDISARLAKKLGCVFIYTGAMYRALALLCIRNGVAFKDTPRVMALLTSHTIDLVKPGPDSRRPYSVLLDSEDVTESLFSPEVDRGSSDVGVLPDVRKYMVEKQREMANDRSVVMEGRDIGLRVLPDADLKIYLNASVETRAKRRLVQSREKGRDIRAVEMVRDTKARDFQDTTRKTDPLQKLPDAWELDTTQLSQDEVISAIVAELKRRNII